MFCSPLRSSSARSSASASATRSPPRSRRGCGWAACRRSVISRVMLIYVIISMCLTPNVNPLNRFHGTRATFGATSYRFRAGEIGTDAIRWRPPPSSLACRLGPLHEGPAELEAGAAPGVQEAADVLRAVVSRGNGRRACDRAAVPIGIVQARSPPRIGVAGPPPTSAGTPFLRN